MDNVQYKIEYNNVLYGGIDDKKQAMDELIKSMRNTVKSKIIEQFIIIKRREGFNGKWKIVYKGIYEWLISMNSLQ